MEFLLTLSASIAWIFPVLVVLTVLVFFHELGHYWVARKNGVRVEVFSIGFGPELFGWNDRHQTRWKFSLIPLGGYVKMFGDADASSAADHEKLKKLTPAEKKQTLEGKTIPQKMAVVVAGPVANILVTMLCFWVVFWVDGEPLQNPVVGDVMQGMPAWEAGIRPGDKVLFVGQQPIKTFRDMSRAIAKRPSEHVAIVYERGGFRAGVYVQPTNQNGHGIIGIAPQKGAHNGFTSAVAAVKGTLSLSWRMLKMFGHFISGKEDSKQIGGLPSIAKMSKDAWSKGFLALLTFMAILSLNLGIINLLPVPVLDGGHLLFYAIEAIRGKPVGEKMQEFSYKIGFTLLISLMIYSHWNDFVRFKFFAVIQAFLTKLF